MLTYSTEPVFVLNVLSSSAVGGYPTITRRRYLIKHENRIKYIGKICKEMQHLGSSVNLVVLMLQAP